MMIQPIRVIQALWVDTDGCQAMLALDNMSLVIYVARRVVTLWHVFTQQWVHVETPTRSILASVIRKLSFGHNKHII